jgi:hypothetical protein
VFLSSVLELYTGILTMQASAFEEAEKMSQ